GGERLITVQAKNVNFNFGTSIITATNGQALFVINDSGMAGQGSITVGTSALGGLSHTFTWSFNNMNSPVNDSVTTGPAPMSFVSSSSRNVPMSVGHSVAAVQQTQSLPQL